jgi:hypothetical protein
MVHGRRRWCLRSLWDLWTPKLKIHRKVSSTRESTRKSNLAPFRLSIVPPATIAFHWSTRSPGYRNNARIWTRGIECDLRPIASEALPATNHEHWATWCHVNMCQDLRPKKDQYVWSIIPRNPDVDTARIVARHPDGCMAATERVGRPSSLARTHMVLISGGSDSLVWWSNPFPIPLRTGQRIYQDLKDGFHRLGWAGCPGIIRAVMGKGWDG